QRGNDKFFFAVYAAKNFLQQGANKLYTHDINGKDELYYNKGKNLPKTAFSLILKGKNLPKKIFVAHMLNNLLFLTVQPESIHMKANKEQNAITQRIEMLQSGYRRFRENPASVFCHWAIADDEIKMMD